MTSDLKRKYKIQRGKMINIFAFLVFKPLEGVTAPGQDVGGVSLCLVDAVHLLSLELLQSQAQSASLNSSRLTSLQFILAKVSLSLSFQHQIPATLKKKYCTPYNP